MKKYSKVYHLKKWDGQVPVVGSKAEWLPQQIEFNYDEDNNEREEIHYFTVIGNMWDVEFNTGFKFYKAFETEEQADIFFQAFIKKYPNSKMYLREKTSNILKKYT